MTKIDIISGFLGAGKTTLIKKLLEEGFKGEKVVLIENEFGEIGIDGTLLKDYGIEIREMNSGCICCTISGDFSLALKEMLKIYHPDRIIIEPSGVGKLSDVLAGCRPFTKKGHAILNMCITVIDGTKYKMYLKNFAEFYKDQIKNAGTVILSRTRSMKPDAVEYIIKDVNKYNDKASLVTTDWDLLDGSKIIELAEGGKTSYEKLVKSEHHHADEVFSVWGVETVRHYPEKKLREILNGLSHMQGTILRAKGIINAEEGKWLQFDYVPGEITINESAPDYTGRICVIGEKIDKAGLKKLFGE